nr:unnamed protein product [Spirometra erinaceieuropaei]
MDRALPRRPQSSIHHLRRRHRPLLQVETNAELDIPPYLHETIRAVQQLSSGEAPGLDAIPAEIYKHSGPQLMAHLTALFQEMWRQDKYRRIPRTPQSCINRSGKKTAKSATAAEMVRQLHDGMMARVTDNGAVSEAFAVTNGVKQDCVLEPTLFSLMFTAMRMDAYRGKRPGIRVVYRTDCSTTRG